MPNPTAKERVLEKYPEATVVAGNNCVAGTAYITFAVFAKEHPLEMLRVAIGAYAYTEQAAWENAYARITQTGG